MLSKKISLKDYHTGINYTIEHQIRLLFFENHTHLQAISTMSLTIMLQFGDVLTNLRHLNRLGKFYLRSHQNERYLIGAINYERCH